MTLRIWVALGAMFGSFLVSGVAGQAQAAAQATDPASLVNPFIGTTNGADDFPGADVPFGMVQWSPDTSSRPDGGGYDYNSSTITGFSLTHMSGPGCGAYGDVPIMPTVGAINTSATSTYSHSNESASPGYYSVGLDNGVKTELTTTTRGGIGRFTFPSSTQANLLFKLTGSQNGDSATSWQAVSSTQVVGSVTSGNFCGAGNSYTVYFTATFDHPFTTGTFTASGVNAGAKTLSEKSTATTSHPAAQTKVEQPNHPALHGKTPAAITPLAGPNGGYLTFNTTSNQVVQARIGISFTSAANATANQTAEVPNFDFSGAQTAAHNAWSSALGKIAVTGGTTAQQNVFYSSLYHALLHPNVFSDENGQYRGFDGNVHTAASGHAHYANYSGWDIYRSQAQLIAMIAPSQAADVAQSMVDDYSASGMLPKWAQANGETYVMVGDPADSIIADIYAFGAHGFDTSAALSAMIHEATTAGNIRPGLNYLNSPGYLPSDGSYGCCNFYGPVSTQLEYDTADFALSAFAGALGDTTDQTTFVNRAQNWRNTFNTSTGFMQPRLASGSWTGGFDPTSGNNFVEGSSWQYTGMVPFNVHGLAVADGGNSALNAYLDHVLAGYNGAGGSVSDLGNEPSIELPWEYDYTGQPSKTEAVVRAVQNQLWPDSPTGWGVGNDDLGTMSAWYVWSAMGIYPETPGTANLALGTPEFSQVAITLPSGSLTINAPQNGTYVQSATWNGGSWNNAYLPPSAVQSGGTLNFTLGGSPSTWATAASSAPPSYPGTVAPPPGTRTGPISSAIAGKCADINNSGTANGTAVQLYDCNGTDAQRWTVNSNGTLNALGKCMDVSGSGTANGTKVQLWDCNGTGAQQWTYNTTTKALTNPESGRCLDDPNSTTTNGTQLQIYDCNSTNAQQWTLPS
jgi:predicted alpha-1,2-mannosidase